MALINKETGAYLRIEKIRLDIDAVDYKIYRDASIREAEKLVELSEFEVIKSGMWNTAVIPEVICKKEAPAGKNILDGFKTLCYEHMLLDESAFGKWESDEPIV